MVLETLVVVPYTRPPAWGWRDAWGTIATPRFVDVSRAPDAYWELLAALWGDRRDFILVEHDVVPDLAALEDLEDCDRRWCAQPYRYLHGQLNWGLSCTRFRRAAMDATPDLWARVAVMSDHLHGPKHWCRLDAWSYRLLNQAGVQRHDHGLTVWHTHERSSHGCELA